MAYRLPLLRPRRFWAIFVPCFFVVALLAPPARADLDIVFVLDTTGSMGGELREAKERIVDLARSIRAARPDERVRFGIVAFRDRGDDYLTRVLPLADEVEGPLAFLQALEPGGGGDSPEDVLAGVGAALRESGWAPESERMLFLVGDAPAHLDYADGPSADELILEARRERIAVHAIGCRSLPPKGVGFFRRLAYATEGSYQHIGAVRSAEPELAAALLRAVVPAAAAPAGEPLALAPLAHRQGGAGPALLVRQGGPGDGTQGGAGALATCTLEVRVPPGFALDAEPAVRLGEGVLEVTLDLGVDEAGIGSIDLFDLQRCPPLATPIRVAVEEG